MAAEHKIGSTYAGMTLLSALATPVPTPRSVYTAGERVTLGDATARYTGFPTVDWIFGVLTEAQRDQLRTFCTGASATVYIRTQNADGDYTDYDAIMVWPEVEDFRGGLVFDLRIRFQNLVVHT